MRKIAKRIRQFFYLTPRDLGAQISSVEEIAKIMKDTSPLPEPLPWEFASIMRRTLFKDTTRTL